MLLCYTRGISWCHKIRSFKIEYLYTTFFFYTHLPEILPPIRHITVVTGSPRVEPGQPDQPGVELVANRGTEALTMGFEHLPQVVQHNMVTKRQTTAISNNSIGRLQVHCTNVRLTYDASIARSQIHQRPLSTSQ